MRADWEREYTDYVGARLNALHRQAYLLTGNGDQADDLVQQTCPRRIPPTCGTYAPGDVTPLSGRVTRAMDINSAGWIAGVAEDGMPVIIDPASEKSLRLPAVATAPGAGWPVSVAGAMSISDDGRAVTALLVVDKRNYPVRWTCS